MKKNIITSGLVAKNIITGKGYAVPSGAMVVDSEALRVNIETALAYTTYSDLVNKWNKASDTARKTTEAYADGNTTENALVEAEAKREKAYTDLCKARACVLGVEYTNNDNVWNKENNTAFDKIFSTWLVCPPFALLLAFCMTGTKSVNTDKLEYTIADSLKDKATINKALNTVLLPILKDDKTLKPFTSGITDKGFTNLERVRDVVKRTWNDKGIKTAETKKRELLRQTLLTAFEEGYNLHIVKNDNGALISF